MTIRQIVEEWLDIYNRHLKGSKEAESLIKELEQINK